MRSFRSALVIVLTVVVAGTVVPQVHAQEAVIGVPVGQSRLLNLANIQRVVVAAPQIADVNVITRNQLMVIAKSIGVTTLSVWTAEGLRVFKVAVISASPADIEASIRQVLNESDIKVAVSGDTIVLQGTVATDVTRAQAEQLASTFGKRVVNLLTVRQPGASVGGLSAQRLRQALSAYNVTIAPTSDDTVRVEGIVPTAYDVRYIETTAKTYFKNVVMLVRAATPSQVQISSVVVEIDRTALNDLGVEYGGGDPVNFITQPYMMPFGLFQSATNQAQALQLLIARIHALEQRNAARTLANPRLVVLDGQAAKMLVGGEVPIPTAQTNGAVTITFKEFGIRLEFKPTVEPGAPIHLDVLTEVSSLDFSNAIISNGFTIPTIKSRHAETSVAILPGQFLVIGGLIQHDDSRVVNKLPVLGDIPVLGALFRSTRFQRNETELVIFISPSLVTPQAQQPEVPAVPNPDDLNP